MPYFYLLVQLLAVYLYWWSNDCDSRTKWASNANQRLLIFLRLHWSLRMLHPTSFCSLGPYLGHPTTTLWTQGLGIAGKTFQRRRTRDERTIDFHVVTYFMGCAGCPLVMTIIHYIVSIRFNSFLCLPCVPDSSYLVATSRYMSQMTSKSILATARSVISAALTILATIRLQPRFRLFSVIQKSRKAVSAQSNGKERHDTDEIAEARHSDEIYRYLSQRHLKSEEHQMTASWAIDWVGLWIENRQKTWFKKSQRISEQKAALNTFTGWN